MVLYIESNFVLELVFDQEERTFAEQILGFVEQGGASLRLPAFTLIEPFYRVTSQVKRRSELRRLLEQERKHLARVTDETLRSVKASVTQSIRALDEANLTDYERLYVTLDRTLACAQVLAITRSTYLRARRYQDEYDLEYPDAVIAASVIEDLERHQDLAAFVCRDAALTDSMVRAEFERRHCVLLTNFERAAHFVTGRKGFVGSA